MKKTHSLQVFFKVFFRILATLILVSIILSAIFYPEPYLWTEEFISNLGRLTSRSGLDNTTSRLIFGISFMVIGLGCFIASVLYFLTSHGKKLEILKGVLLVLAGFGALGTSIPSGLPSTSAVHIWGTVLFIFSFTIYLALAQFVKYEKIEEQSIYKKIDDILDKIMVVIVILAGALFLLAYILWWREYLAIFQKLLLVITIILVFMLDLDDF